MGCARFPLGLLGVSACLFGGLSLPSLRQSRRRSLSASLHRGFCASVVRKKLKWFFRPQHLPRAPQVGKGDVHAKERWCSTVIRGCAETFHDGKCGTVFGPLCACL